MSLPPILSNLPFLKLFKGSDPAEKTGDTKAAPKADKSGAAKSGDEVQISAAARAKLAADGSKDASEARDLAQKAKSQLAGEQVSLGLPSDFS